MTTYKVYMTVEIPGTFDNKEAAMDAAVKALQDAVDISDNSARTAMWEHIAGGTAIEARVFESGKITHGGQHAFIVDIHDGAI